MTDLTKPLARINTLFLACSSALGDAGAVKPFHLDSSTFSLQGRVSAILIFASGGNL